MFIIVLLPEPDGPTIATNSPRPDVEVDVAGAPGPSTWPMS